MHGPVCSSRKRPPLPARASTAGHLHCPVLGPFITACHHPPLHRARPGGLAPSTRSQCAPGDFAEPMSVTCSFAGLEPKVPSPRVGRSVLSPKAPGRVLPASSLSWGLQTFPGPWPHPSGLCLRLRIASPPCPFPSLPTGTSVIGLDPPSSTVASS